MSNKYRASSEFSMLLFEGLIENLDGILVRLVDSRLQGLCLLTRIFSKHQR